MTARTLRVMRAVFGMVLATVIVCMSVSPFVRSAGCSAGGLIVEAADCVEDFADAVDGDAAAHGDGVDGHAVDEVVTGDGLAERAEAVAVAEAGDVLAVHETADDAAGAAGDGGLGDTGDGGEFGEAAAAVEVEHDEGAVGGLEDGGALADEVDFVGEAANGEAGGWAVRAVGDFVEVGRDAGHCFLLLKL